MSDTVKVDGIFLTREQIEQAYRELNPQANPPVDETQAAQALHLKLVKMKGYRGRMGIVLSKGEVHATYKKGFNTPPRSYILEGPLTVVDNEGGGYTYTNLKSFYRTWSLV